MLTLIVTIIILSEIAAYFTDRPYKKGLREVERLKERGDQDGAADAYLLLLEQECGRRMKNSHRIAYLTNSVQPLLEYTGRRQEERRVLERSMRLCITATHGRNWEHWQRRLAELDKTKED